MWLSIAVRMCCVNSSMSWSLLLFHLYFALSIKFTWNLWNGCVTVAAAAVVSCRPHLSSLTILLTTKFFIHLNWSHRFFFIHLPFLSACSVLLVYVIYLVCIRAAIELTICWRHRCRHKRCIVCRTLNIHENLKLHYTLWLLLLSNGILFQIALECSNWETMLNVSTSQRVRLSAIKQPIIELNAST